MPRTLARGAVAYIAAISLASLLAAVALFRASLPAADPISFLVVAGLAALAPCLSNSRIPPSGLSGHPAVYRAGLRLIQRPRAGWLYRSHSPDRATPGQAPPVHPVVQCVRLLSECRAGAHA